MKTSWNLKLLALLPFILGCNAEGVWIETGGNPNDGTAYATFLNDVTFEITPSGNGHAVIGFVVDEAVSSDGNQDLVDISGLTYSVNNGPIYALESWADNDASSWGGDITANDSDFANFIGPWVSAGDIVTLHAGTATFTSASPAFNLFESGDYTMFIANDGGDRISYDAIPEPSTIALQGLFLCFAACARRVKYGRPILLFGRRRG